MSKQPNYVFDDELYHHGIIGQRWGFRRFQNEDGSWTAEGRERYGEGGTKSKSDVQKYKAKVTYNTQKYKADLKLKAQKEKIARAAKEEKVRIKEQGKIDRAARKEQNKLDRKQAKLDNKLAREQAKAKDTASLKNKLVRTKRYAMSDDELSQAIDRLKLEVEYNKQYALAAKPNGALARADRFFSGPTGKFVSDLAVATIPNVARDVAGKVTDYAIKKASGPSDSDKLDAIKKQADIQFTLANARKANAEADDKYFKMNKTYQEQHQKEVKERAERMFGSNKDKVQTQQKPKTGIQGQAWKVVPKSESTKTETPKVNTNTRVPTWTDLDRKGITYDSTVENVVKKKTFADLHKKYVKKKRQYL